MAINSFELYLDESGSFDTDAVDTRHAPSLVGGMLCRAGVLSDGMMNALVPDSLHACVEYKKAEFFSILRQLKESGVEFVIISNEERLRIVDGDVTYLNIISEGLVQLFLALRSRYPNEQIHLKAVIAKRQNVSAKAAGYSTVIRPDDYTTRLEEKLIIGLERAKLSELKYDIVFDDARYSKRLMCADIICNTYLTRYGRKKFTDEDRLEIDRLFDDAFIRSVFEDATVRYLKSLLSEDRLGEAMGQLSLLPKLNSDVQKIRDMIMRRLEQLSDREREVHFSYASLQLSRFNYGNDFPAGIQFGENYRANILVPAKEHKELAAIADFRTFDTDFYILTMYQQLGNSAKCAEYIDRCYANIGSINHSWEHIDYYFLFKIRELNIRKMSYDFEGVLAKADELCRILEDAKSLFGMIGAYEETQEEIRSELLGKVYGLKLQTYINLLPKHPELYEKALEASDRSLSEFTQAHDIMRQKQLRCQLMVTSKRPQEALDCLLYQFQVDDPKRYVKFINQACSNSSKPDEFSLLHYTNVMLLLAEQDSKTFDAMSKTLLNNKNFSNALKDESRCAYPWIAVLWNISKYYRTIGNDTASARYRERALHIAALKKENDVMMLYGVGILAEAAMHADEKSKNEMLKKMYAAIETILKENCGEFIKELLQSCLTGDNGRIDLTTLAECGIK